jgi:hypothetical protein
MTWVVLLALLIQGPEFANEVPESPNSAISAFKKLQQGDNSMMNPSPFPCIPQDTLSIHALNQAHVSGES